MSQIVKIVETWNGGEVALLESNKLDDLSRMYDLFSYVDGGLELMLNTMAEHVKVCGERLVHDPELGKDPVSYVCALLELRGKYEKIIRSSFLDDKTFTRALDNACMYAINQDPRSPEFVSLFIDDAIRKEHQAQAQKAV